MNECDGELPRSPGYGVMFNGVLCDGEEGFKERSWKEGRIDLNRKVKEAGKKGIRKKGTKVPGEKGTGPIGIALA
jgi:hypothetical protein